MLLGGISDFLKFRVENDHLTKQETYNFVEGLYKLIGKNAYKDWKAAKLNEDELWEYLKHDHLKFILQSSDSGIEIADTCLIEDYVRTGIGYDQMTIYSVRNNEVIPLKSGNETEFKASVGMLYMFRDKHDVYHGNSGSSIPESDMRGIPKDKDSGKADGRDIYGKKAAKFDILTNTYQLQQITNASIVELFDTKHDTHYVIKEEMNAVGMDLSLSEEESEDE